MANRSLEEITKEDLRRLATFAQEHRERWFRFGRPTNVFETASCAPRCAKERRSITSTAGMV